MRLNTTWDRAVAMLAFLSGIALAVLAALQVAAVVIVVVAILFVVAMLGSFVPPARRWWVEQRPRVMSRRREHLRLVRGKQAGMPPSDLPDGVYGYEEIFAVKGMQQRDESPAKLKPNPIAPDGHAYPIEVHRFAAETFLVGYVSDTDAKLLASGRGCHLTLWMRRQMGAPTRARTLAEVPLSRVDDDVCDGDGSEGSGAFRLELDLAPV
jgi:hypothetical protein